MKNILLVCNAGMSTSMLVQKMQAAAKEQGIEATIQAKSVTDAANESAAKRGAIDDIIIPDATRKRLIMAYEMLYGKKQRNEDKKHTTI